MFKRNWMKTINIVGAGLAGSEIALQLAKRDFKIKLFEMRPEVTTPAHQSDKFAELVCSNSFKSTNPNIPAGMLKNELRGLKSYLIEAADKFSIPGGNSLTVDREKFSSYITDIIMKNKNINFINKEFTELSTSETTVIASGPLTSEKLSENIIKVTESRNFYFYDAIAPIVEASSIDMSNAFLANRYDTKNNDYINCPLSEQEYHTFVKELKSAKTFPYKEFEKPKYFDGCMPIEEMAERGNMTLAFGPMRPVGLVDPHGKQHFAIVQLRRENIEGTSYNIVGFQTKMTYPEQDRVLRLIPALKDANFLRYGSLHRNSYINAPHLLNQDMSLKNMPNIFIAGQLSGVEGYIESIAQGLLVGVIIYNKYLDNSFQYPPPSTALGSLYNHLTEDKGKFVPSNINFSLFKYGEEISKIRNKDKRREAVVKQSEISFKEWLQNIRW